MSPIANLTTNVQKAFMQIGTIRKGEMQATKNGQGTRPVDLDYFRVTHKAGENSHLIEEAFRTAYGEKPTQLNIRLAYPTVNESWDANYECYKKGGLIAKAGVGEAGPYWIFYRDPKDSEVLVRDGNPVGDRGRAFISKPFHVDDPIYYNSANEPQIMKPVGRLQVVIPEVAHLAVGYYLFQPGSPRDIRTISAELGAYESVLRSMGRSLTGVPFKLIRREEEVTKNIKGVLSKGQSWVVHVEVTGEWGRQAIEMIDRLALPDVVEAEYEDVVPEEDEFTSFTSPNPAPLQLPPSKNAPKPVQAEEGNAGEMIDPLGPTPVQWAMKELGRNEKETRKLISTNANKFPNPMPKNVFKTNISLLAGAPKAKE